MFSVDSKYRKFPATEKFTTAERRRLKLLTAESEKGLRMARKRYSPRQVSPVKKAQPPGRFTLEQARAEIEEQFRRRGRGSRKALAADIGLSPPDITKRQDDVDAHWDWNTLGRVAAAWDAPPGWPIIPWDEAVERDEAFLSAKKAKNPGNKKP